MQLEQIDFTLPDASYKFAKSLELTGFAVLKNHPIKPQLIKEVFDEWADFFASNYKNNYLYNNDTQDGFFPIDISEKAVGYDVKDIKEYFHYYPQGQYPKELSNKTKELAQEMHNIATRLLTWVEEHLPENIKMDLSQPLATMPVPEHNTLMRILHYPPLTGNEVTGAIRANPHTDINLLTVLVAASQSGLEVQDINGNWIEIPVDPGMLSINIGDMLQEASHGFYKSTVHRVINPSDDSRLKSRYSIPLFLHAKPDVVLSNRYTAGKFLIERLKIIGVKK